MLEDSKALVPVEQKVVELYGDELTAVRVDRDGRDSRSGCRGAKPMWYISSRVKGFGDGRQLQ
jgi:hypothetical protein